MLWIDQELIPLYLALRQRRFPLFVSVWHPLHRMLQRSLFGVSSHNIADLALAVIMEGGITPLQLALV